MYDTLAHSQNSRLPSYSRTQFAQSYQSFQVEPPAKVLFAIQDTVPKFQPMPLPGAWASRQAKCPFSQDFASGLPTKCSNPNVVDSFQSSSITLEQLQGYWKVNKSSDELIQVRLASQGYGVVVRVSLVMEDVATHYIYEHDARYTLYSLNGHLPAAALKGRSTKHTVMWYSIDGTVTEWQRTGKVDCTLSEISSISRKSSLSELQCPSEQSSIFALSEESTEIIDVRSEFRKPPDHFVRDHACTKTVFGNSNFRSYSSQPQTVRRFTDDELLEDFKVYCRKYSNLMHRVLVWGICQSSYRQVDKKEFPRLVQGRVWVSACLSDPCGEGSKYYQDILDSFKGAYEEGSRGVYFQCIPQQSRPGVQYRLQRNKAGLWIMEEYNNACGYWLVFAQEVYNGIWVDTKTGRKLYKIQIISIVQILSRMGGEWSDHREIKENINFLYNACNQQKLNTKVKMRNLRHNIVNLKMKLEKQYALSFAVQVAKIADTIVMEEGC